jgi:enoyl-CoA hydratase/carnithine racemase
MSDSVCWLAPELMTPVGDWVPAEAVVEEAAVVVVEGDVPDSPIVRRFLRQAVALTIGLGPTDIGFDLWSTDPVEVEQWVDQASRHPLSSVAAALLLRQPKDDVWRGLVDESATYSVLQSGPEFGAWLGSSRRPARATDRDPRVRTSDLNGGRACEIVLTRPARHNALDVQMREELLTVLDDIRRRPPAPVLLRAEGPSFCSGGDLGEFGTFDDPASAHTVRLRRSLARRFAELGPRMVVGLHGSCLGAGIELPAFAGRVVAADNTVIGLPEGGLGLIPGAGGTVSIPRRIGAARTLDLIISGRQLDAVTAAQWGLVDEVVPRPKLLRHLRESAV